MVPSYRSRHKIDALLCFVFRTRDGATLNLPLQTPPSLATKSLRAKKIRQFPTRNKQNGKQTKFSNKPNSHNSTNSPNSENPAQIASFLEDYFLVLPESGRG
jgi:hypothetical protein